jgi:hypothetical protein
MAFSSLYLYTKSLIPQPNQGILKSQGARRA